ncbi:MAG: hypothetical protein WC796_06145 [Candidatus Pacearchaeota archaeon]
MESNEAGRLETGLEGRIEKVKLIEISRSGMPLGIVLDWPLCKDVVSVIGANDYIGRYCLARFDAEKTHANMPPFANFLSPIAQEKSFSADSSDCLLFGVWKESWKKQKRFPSHEEIGQYYSIGELGRVLYFEFDSDRVHGRVVITKRGIEYAKGSLSYLLKNFFFRNPGKCNVVLAENSCEFLPVKKQAEMQNYRVIKLYQKAS